MNSLFKNFKTTKLARKLIRKMALIIAASFVLSTLIAFVIFWPRLRDDAQGRAIAINEYITDSINELFLNLEGYADLLISSPTLQEKLEEFQRFHSQDSMADIETTLLSSMPASSNVRAVTLQCSDDFFQAGHLGTEDYDLLESSWYHSFLKDSTTSAWSSFYASEIDDHSRNTILRLSVSNINDRQYTIAVFYDADPLMEKIDWLTENMYNGYALAIPYEKEYALFYESGDTANITTQLDVTDNPKQLISKNDIKGYYYFSTIPASNWIFCGYLSYASFNSNLLPFIVLLFIIIAVMAILLFIFLFPSVNATFAPLGKLEATMRKVSESGPDFYSEIQSDDEIGVLSDVFNDMLDDMRISTEEKIEQGKREQMLQSSLMLSQINSHFFYNTLNMINSLSRQGRLEDVIRANTALTTIFQDCLRSMKTGMTDTVMQEITITNCYWSIATLNPQNKAELIWDIPDELLNDKIPKNIIQPLVENALFHGLDDLQTGIKSGWIKISLQKAHEQLVLTVSNNGLPVNPEILIQLNADTAEEPLRNDRHIGIPNIKRRLHLLYGDSARIEITSDTITECLIYIPAQ